MTIMKTKAKTFYIIIWSTLALACCNALAAKEPLYDGLGSYSREITTDSPEAQRYFDQGLGFLHGFNHRAAIRAFQQAAELDPECAMAHWGVALACGPHINSMAVSTQNAELAWKELQLAQKNAGNASPVERALIDALAKRYANPQPEDRSGLDRAYADAMREVWKEVSEGSRRRRSFRGSNDELAAVGSMDTRRQTAAGNAMRSRHSGRGAETQSEPSPREPSLHSRGGSIAESGARDRCRGPASQFTARPCSQRAYAVAYRHSHRPMAEGRRYQ